MTPKMKNVARRPAARHIVEESVWKRLTKPTKSHNVLTIIKRQKTAKKLEFQGKADEIPAIPRAASHVKKPCTVA